MFKKNLLVQMHKRKQIKLLNLLTLHFYKCQRGKATFYKNALIKNLVILFVFFEPIDSLF